MKNYFLIIILLIINLPSYAKSYHTNCSTKDLDSAANLPKIFNNIYLELQLGISDINYQDTNLLTGYTIKTSDQQGFATHISLGKTINNYFATELAVFYLKKPLLIGVTENNSVDKIKNNILSWLFKLTTDWVNCHWYVKFGPGMIARRGIRLNNVIILTNKVSFNLVVGAGFDYPLNNRIHLDGSVFYFPAKHTNQQPHAIFLGIGLYYLFNHG